VDAQSSANGGIIIQVIGEMSNRKEPWRKFVQTFFLAEQPNGYFVLNDIFRFLKEETVESDEDREDELPAQDIPTSSSPSPGQPSVPVFEAPPESELAEESVSAPSPAPPIEQLPITVISEPVLEPQTNGVHTPVPPEPEPEPTPVVAEKSPVPVPATTVTPEPPAASPVPTPSSPAVSASAPPSAPSPAPSSQPIQPLSQPTPPPQPTAPPAPKTWANLAAANSKKWGSAVAQESRGTTEVPTTSTPPNAPQPPGFVPAPGHRDHHLFHVAAQSVTTPQCFVKGVVESISESALRQVITHRFGPIKELEVVRSKACAFLEFIHLDSAKRAIFASMSPAHGGGGGVRIDVDGGHVKILIETRKERGERPVSRPRGGSPGQNVNGGGDGRGGFRGRGGVGGGRGRGGPK